ncbi:hypothetical protein GCM10023322_06870 [Rugosimonospora acidiphila]|uniref:Ricin B lectin domain-containing protein n=1 Tax=Rugosimonospora acidiphila TaxID=556531 RepID=A0ABP9RK11_9ACTN
MEIRTLLRQRLRVTAALAAAAIGALSLPATPANAAAVYWNFRNAYTGNCLTAGVNNGGTGKAYVTTCTYGASQEWDFVGGVKGEQQLKNKATGLCLDTDNKSSQNVVWTDSCSLKSDGEYFAYSHNLYSYADTWLYTSTANPGAVYGTRDATTQPQFVWTGSTN